MEIIRKSPRLVGGIAVEDHPHIYKDLPKKFPNGYFQLVHPKWVKGHNLVCNTTLVGHLEEAADLVHRGYRLRMSERGCGHSPNLVIASELEIFP